MTMFAKCTTLHTPLYSPPAVYSALATCITSSFPPSISLPLFLKSNLTYSVVPTPSIYFTGFSSSTPKMSVYSRIPSIAPSLLYHLHSEKVHSLLCVQLNYFLHFDNSQIYIVSLNFSWDFPSNYPTGSQT